MYVSYPRASPDDSGLMCSIGLCRFRHRRRHVHHAPLQCHSRGRRSAGLDTRWQSVEICLRACGLQHNRVRRLQPLCPPFRGHEVRLLLLLDRIRQLGTAGRRLAVLLNAARLTVSSHVSLASAGQWSLVKAANVSAETLYLRQLTELKNQFFKSSHTLGIARVIQTPNAGGLASNITGLPRHQPLSTPSPSSPRYHPSLS